MSEYNPGTVTSIQQLNTELTKIAAAFEQTLSRSFKTPNYMDTDLDMNSQRILNLVAPVQGNEPVRLRDIPGLVANKGESYRVPPFDGAVFNLPRVTSEVQVFLNGRYIYPNYALASDGTSVTLDYPVTKEDRIIVILGGLQVPTESLLDQNVLQVFETVEEMVQDFGNSPAKACMTLAYNAPVVSTWKKVLSGAGDMSDGTLILDNGTYVKLDIQPFMHVKAFGAYGDHDPFGPVVHDDTVAIQNCINNCTYSTCSAGDSFAITDHIQIPSDRKVDFLTGSFYGYIQSDPIRAVGRDRGMFEIVGTFGDKIQESGVWTQWREGAETFPSPDTSVILSEEFILLTVGQLPNGPSEAYMVRPMPVRATVSDPATRFQTDYRLGWTHSNATFRYFAVTPVKNVSLSIGHIEDMTTFEYDETDLDGNRKSASGVVMEAAVNCHVQINTSKNWQYPTVMTYYTTDCSVSDVFQLPSERDSIGIDGWGIIVQWNNALRARSYNLSAQGNRRVLDYTQCAYCYAENIGGESTRDGEMTTHGSYEHNLTYVNTRGFMSFANSGEEFGESTKDITVLHHHGSDVFAVTNVLNLHLQDVRCNSIRVNSVGLVMENCSLYDLQTSVDNLCQINNWSAKIGKPYEPKDAVIENSQLGSNGLVFLVDQDIQADETITFANCDIELRQGDFAGPANIVFDNCNIRPKNGTGQLVLVANPTSIRFDNCKGWNIAFGVQDDVTTPVKLIFDSGVWTGENFDSAFWANEDGKNGGTVAGNYIKMTDVTIDWDNTLSTGLFYDPLQTRNPNWYTKITNCDISGKNGEEIRIPKLRGLMRFGANTLDNVVRNFDALDATYTDYETISI